MQLELFDDKNLDEENLSQQLNSWFQNNDINSENIFKKSLVAETLRKNLKLMDRWKNSPRKVQGIASNEFFEQEWRGMPEFVQENLMPFKTVMIHFENQENVLKFSELIKQKITNLTKSLWYPKAELIKPSEWQYVDSK